MTASAAEPKRMQPAWPLLVLVLALGLAAAAPARGQLLELATGDANGPIYLTHSGDDRLFVVERSGRIRILQSGVLLPAPFLDLTAAVDAAGEGGLLTVAFHPDYAANGAFYVNYTTDDPVTGFTSVVSRFHVSAGDANLADPGSEAVLLELPQPFTNHNGGQLAFGPDRRLYVGFGDGGDRDDPGCRAQRPDTWHGKLLRLDVDPTGDQPPHYTIPADNPFAGGGDGVLDEILDVGLRNPWRFSFDRETGDLWIGDVGQDAVEEVDLRPASGAGPPGTVNWGWKAMEGNACANPDREMCPAGVPACGDASYEPPVNQYPHQAGNRSITGGYLYRGVQAPGFVGTYVFGDYGSGRIFALRETSPGSWQRTVLLDGGPQWVSFGEGADGELYAVDLIGDAVYRLDLAAALSAEAGACIVALNESFAKVARARARQLARCAKRAAAGKLAAGAEACAALADAKVEKASARTSKLEAKRCAALPPFGATDAPTVNAAAIASELDLLHDVLGDLDAALVAKADDPTAAACQAKAVKGLQRCQAARVKEFVRCKEGGLRDGSLADAFELADCLGADPKGKVTSRCGALATKVLVAKCAARGVDLGAAFPACATADAGALFTCAEAAGRCRLCTAFSAADALAADCDLFDDATPNDSCV